MSWVVKKIARVKQDVPDDKVYTKFRGLTITVAKVTQTTKGKMNVYGTGLQIPIKYLEILGDVD